MTAVQLERELTAGYDLGPLERIPPGEARAYRAGGREIAVYRARTGAVYATQAACPHRGGPLADGLIGAGKVVCPLHGYQFELAGGRAVGNACAALDTYPVWVDAQGNVWVALPQP